MTTATNSDGLLEFYIGGPLETVDGLTANNLAIWNGTAWRGYEHLPPGNFGPPGPVEALTSGPFQFAPDIDTVFAAGHLGYSDGTGLVRIQAVEPSGISFSPNYLIFPGNLTGPPGGQISRLAYSSDKDGASLFMGGFFFSQTPGQPLGLIDRLALAGSQWEQVADPDACGQTVSDFLEVDDPALGSGIFFTGDIYFTHPDLPAIRSFGFWDGEGI
jgi:hypothetical protein